MGKKNNGLMTVASSLAQYTINNNNNDDVRTSRSNNIASDILLPLQHQDDEALYENDEAGVSSMES